MLCYVMLWIVLQGGDRTEAGQQRLQESELRLVSGYITYCTLQFYFLISVFPQWLFCTVSILKFCRLVFLEHWCPENIFIARLPTGIYSGRFCVRSLSNYTLATVVTVAWL